MNVEWTSRAVRETAALDPTVKRRLLDGLERYAATESGDVKRLQDVGGMLRLRIGDWRIIFEKHSGGDLLVLRVLHRSQAYR